MSLLHQTVMAHAYKHSTPWLFKELIEWHGTPGHKESHPIANVSWLCSISYFVHNFLEPAIQLYDMLLPRMRCCTLKVLAKPLNCHQHPHHHHLKLIKTLSIISLLWCYALLGRNRNDIKIGLWAVQSGRRRQRSCRKTPRMVSNSNAEQKWYDSRIT